MVKRWLLRRCESCWAYTLREDRCPYCGGRVRVPHPPRFSPEDRYGEYRRRYKLMLRSAKAEDT